MFKIELRKMLSPVKLFIQYKEKTVGGKEPE